MNARGGFGPRVIDPHILVVDDEPFILEALIDLLEDHFRVSATTDPDEALDLLDREDVAVVLSDQRMPRMSGHELMRLVKEKANARRIIFTAYADWLSLLLGLLFPVGQLKSFHHSVTTITVVQQLCFL